MEFYIERHMDNIFEIKFHHMWFWIRLGKWSFQVNMGSMENC